MTKTNMSPYTYTFRARSLLMRKQHFIDYYDYEFQKVDLIKRDDRTVGVL